MQSDEASVLEALGDRDGPDENGTVGGIAQGVMVFVRSGGLSPSEAWNLRSLSGTCWSVRMGIAAQVEYSERREEATQWLDEEKNGSSCKTLASSLCWTPTSSYKGSVG